MRSTSGASGAALGKLPAERILHLFDTGRGGMLPLAHAVQPAPGESDGLVEHRAERLPIAHTRMLAPRAALVH